MVQRKIAFGLVVGLLLSVLAGCAHLPFGEELGDRECLARAMYFESNRSSPEGMMAVGTTVMNRLAAPGYPKTVCGVVGQPRAYAPGVLSNAWGGKGRRLAEQMADQVLAGARHPEVGDAKFFHTAGWVPPFHNMHYVTVAGGNAFYEKVRAGDQAAPYRAEPEPPPSRMPYEQPEPVFAEAPMPAPLRVAPPRRAPVVAVASSAEPRNMDDILRSTGAAPDAGGTRFRLARLSAPLQIHPSDE